MQGSWNNQAPYYRCVFLAQYAAQNKINHARAVYLREDQILPSVDRWLASKFGAHALRQTLLELAEAQDTDSHGVAATEAKQEIAACDAKLRQHRAALEAGADPVIVTSWIAKVQALRVAAESRLRQAPRGHAAYVHACHHRQANSRGNVVARARTSGSCGP